MSLERTTPPSHSAQELALLVPVEQCDLIIPFPSYSLWQWYSPLIVVYSTHEPSKVE